MNLFPLATVFAYNQNEKRHRINTNEHIFPSNLFIPKTHDGWRGMVWEKRLQKDYLWANGLKGDRADRHNTLGNIMTLAFLAYLSTFFPHLLPSFQPVTRCNPYLSLLESNFG